jgi:hypothetical protein
MEFHKARLTGIVTLAVASLGILGCSKDDNGPLGANQPTGPRVTEFTHAETGGHSSSGTHGVLANVSYQSPVSGYAARMAGIANINLGILEHPVLTTYLQNGYEGGPGQYRVEATYNWKGSIAGNGLAGAGARVEIIMQILDFNGNLIATQDIHEKEVRESALQIGGIIDQGNKQVVADFTLPQGKTGFNIRFKMKCEAWSGIFGGLTQCHFGDTQATGHYSGWSNLKVTAL